ncbi:uncharacterized protein BJ212DRAFT_1205226, partial [Suillus subaureus]
VVHASGLPKTLWGEAVCHAIYMKNQTSTRALNGKMPYKMLNKKKPNLAKLSLWGCQVWVHDPSGSKL